MERFLLALFVALTFATTPVGSRPPLADARHALLIGVTHYPNLRADLSLDGGANDVLMMKRLLVEKFGFAEANVLILSEAEGKKDAKRYPTRENIEREMKALAARVPTGGQALVLMSGHGSRQPEKAGVKGPQPDGFDKIFLPRDVKNFDLADGAVTNAITGRDFGNWLRPIPKKKANLWVIVDSCHSGEMVRGGAEKKRQLDMERDLKVPAKLIKAAEKRAVKSRGHGPEAPSYGKLGHEPGVVLTYACLSTQTTLEGKYPDPYGKGERKPFGLFTHTMTEVLLASDDVLSYRELLTRIINAYTAKGKEGLTPVIDGSAQPLAVLGRSSVARPGFLISHTDDKLTVNAGQLHGLTGGTILAVHPPPGKKGGLIGHVRLTDLAPTRATVAPVAHGKTAAPKADKIVGCRCEVAEVVYDDLRLKVAVDVAGSKASKEKLAALGKMLATIAKEDTSPIRHVTDAARADWLARLAGDELYLVPAGESLDERKADMRRALGPAPARGKHADWLEATCARVVRAENLKRLALSAVAEKTRGASGLRPQLTVTVTREKATKEEKAGALTTLYAGDKLLVRLENKGKVPVDATVLYVDSQYGITSLFPSIKRGEVNRIKPGEHAEVSGIKINGDTLGRENIVVIAVASRGDELADFVALSQKSVDAVKREVKTRSAAQRGAGSPMGLLFQKAMFGGGGKRGVTVEAIEEFQSSLVPVLVMQGKRPGGSSAPHRAAQLPLPATAPQTV